MCRPAPFPALLAAVSIAVAFAGASQAGGSGLVGAAAQAVDTRIEVDSGPGFRVAVAQLAASGGTIVLAPRRYATLAVPPRGTAPLEIVARPGASAERLLLDGTRAVTVSGLRVVPGQGRALVSVVGSRDIVVDGLVLNDGGTGRNADMRVLDSTNVRVVRSSFSRCGSGKPPNDAICLRLRDTRGVVIERSRFRDCNGCDFVHGSYNDDLIVRDSTFERALVAPRCGHHFTECNHQDLLHLIDGSRVLIERNRFGIYEFGEAQVFLSGPIRGVVVRNNVFVGTDPAYPGYAAPRGISLGTKRAADAPRGAIVVGNTILTGHARADGYATSISFVAAYTRLPVEERPFLAGNVLALFESPPELCDRIQASVANVVAMGRPCGDSDAVGDPHLDADGRPTAASQLLIDRADARYAPETDFAGTRRDGRPDVGAFELAPPTG